LQVDKKIEADEEAAALEQARRIEAEANSLTKPPPSRAVSAAAYEQTRPSNDYELDIVDRASHYCL
jgi:hypothetical protein